MMSAAFAIAFLMTRDCHLLMFRFMFNIRFKLDTKSDLCLLMSHVSHVSCVNPHFPMGTSFVRGPATMCWSTRIRGTQPTTVTMAPSSGTTASTVQPTARPNQSCYVSTSMPFSQTTVDYRHGNKTNKYQSRVLLSHIEKEPKENETLRFSGRDWQIIARTHVQHVIFCIEFWLSVNPCFWHWASCMESALPSCLRRH